MPCAWRVITDIGVSRFLLQTFVSLARVLGELPNAESPNIVSL